MSGVDLSALYQLVYWAPFAVFILYGSQLQYYMMSSQVKSFLGKVKSRTDATVNMVVKEVGEYSSNRDVGARLGELMDFKTIMPTSLDPSGIVQKMSFIAGARDGVMKAELRSLGITDGVKLSIAANLLEVGSALTYIYKVVRHYYLLGKKTGSLLLMGQLRMLIPMLQEQLEALDAAGRSIPLGTPVGDGAGPVVVSRFGAQNWRTVATDTVLGEAAYNNRRVLILKAEGPMAWVGNPGEAVQRIIETERIDAVIMIDAALKLEGEKTGEIAEGVGAAIGGIGTDKFMIEQAVTSRKIPLYAVLIKQSLTEAISTMKREIADAVEPAKQRVERLIDTKVPENGTVLIIGVGNTLGVGQGDKV